MMPSAQFFLECVMIPKYVLQSQSFCFFVLIMLLLLLSFLTVPPSSKDTLSFCQTSQPQHPEPKSQTIASQAQNNAFFARGTACCFFMSERHSAGSCYLKNKQTEKQHNLFFLCVCVCVPCPQQQQHCRFWAPFFFFSAQIH